MRILQACAEIYPLLKTGGLADVTGALPLALRKQGADVRVVLPGFAPILDGLEDVRELPGFSPPAQLAPQGARLLYGKLPACSVKAYVIDLPACYLRPGGPYADENQQAYADNAQRFALLGWTAAQLALGLDCAWSPDILHAHDWHAALAPAYLQAAREAGHRQVPPCVYTVHNLAYQGLFEAATFASLELPPHYFTMHGMEFHGQLNFMKAGLHYAELITTVSPSYAQEIQSPEQGCGLDGVLRERSHELAGILNGVDDTVWNPAADPRLEHAYDVDSLAGKARCKATLQRSLGLRKAASAPVFCVISRLTEQKGLHLVLDVLPQLVSMGAQFVMLGSGDRHLEDAFRDLARAHPEAVSVRIGYDEDHAHRLIGGSDVIMVPSHFEPCGLTQLYGLKYGTLPLVRKVGGLADTVADTRLETLDLDATGFVFEPFTAEALLHAVVRALALYRRKTDWALVQRRGMGQQLGWDRAAASYLAHYRALVA